MIKLLYKLKNAVTDEAGIGTIEIVLILVVIIGLVLVFKQELVGLVESVFGHINSSIEEVY